MTKIQESILIRYIDKTNNQVIGVVEEKKEISIFQERQ